MLTLPRFLSPLLMVGLLLIASPLRAAPAKENPPRIDKYLPDDAQGVLVINVQRVLDSALFTKSYQKQVADLLKSDEAKAILKNTGLDPLKDIDRLIVVATPDLVGAGCPFALVEGRFDAAKLQAKIEDEENKGWRLFAVGKVKAYEVTPASGPNVFLAVDKNLLILAPNKEQLVSALEKASGARKTEIKSKALAKLLEKMDPKQAVSVAAVHEMVIGVLSMPVPAKPLPAGERGFRTLGDLGIESVQGGISIGEDLKAKVTITAPNSDAAKKLAGQIDEALSKALAEAKQLADKEKDFEALVESLKGVKVAIMDATLTLEGQAGAKTLNALYPLLGFATPR